RDDLRLAPPALREQRTDRSIDHAGRQRPLLPRPSLALEEAAGDLAGGVHPLLDVDRQGEEVDVADVACGRGRQDHRLALGHDYGAAGLLGELAGLESDLTVSNLDGEPAHISTHMFLSVPPPV